MLSTVLPYPSHHPDHRLNRVPLVVYWTVVMVHRQINHLRIDPQLALLLMKKTQKSQLECDPNRKRKVDKTLTTKTAAAKTIVGDHL